MQGFLSDLFGGSGSHADENQQPVNPEDAASLDEEGGAAANAAAHQDSDEGTHALDLDGGDTDAAAHPAEDAGGDLL